MDSHLHPHSQRDRPWLQALRRGDRAAVERLHREYGEALYRFTYYRLGGRADETEEIVQETFLAALRSVRKFRGDSHIFSWLCGIAKNQISLAHRKHYRDRLAVALDQSETEIHSMLLDLDQAKLPEELLIRQETQDLVGSTLASLPLNYQQVLSAKYMQGQAVKEIANDWDTSTKTIESSLSRARVAFRKAFEIIGKHLGGGSHGIQE